MAGGGLRRLAAAVLGVTLDKAVEVRCSDYGCSLITYGCSLHYMRLQPVHKRLQVRCSDWEAATLSAEQVRYAAEDARVGFELLLALHARCLPPVPLDAWVQRQLAAAPPRRPAKPATPSPPPGRSCASGGGGGAPGGGGGGGAAPTEPKKK
eukprot:scaffold111741_cov67-Phaeocystis_antarctica.AAC.7